MTALVGLYATGEWLFDAYDLRTGYSVVLFGPHGIEYRHPAAERVAELLKNPNVTSIQITFHDERFAGSHSMPPGGFRLAVVNCWDLARGQTGTRRACRTFRPGSARAQLTGTP